MRIRYIASVFRFQTLCYVHVMMEELRNERFLYRKRGIYPRINIFVIATRITILNVVHIGIRCQLMFM